MLYGRLRSRLLVPVVLVFSIAALLTTTSCSSNESKARKAIEEHLQGHGATDVVIDIFYVDSADPDKAYSSATITYDFANSKGKPQREYSGFILAREGKGWRVENSTKYTKEHQKAAVFLAGGK